MAEQMKVGFYGHVRQYHALQEEIDAAIRAVLESGAYVMGPTLTRFERELAEYFGVMNAVGVNSGTDALWLSLMALGVGPGDEVITTTNTFFATAEAIWIAGAKAVFVDSEPKTNNIDVSKIEEAITPKTKAVIPVHLYGQCAAMDEIARIARDHRLFVIEDCAQAVDARGATFRVGEHADAVGVSFIVQKNLGAFGDAGAVLTNRDDVAREVLRMRNHGSLERSMHSFGFNSRLDDIHAGVLSVKLKCLREWSDRRREIARIYDRELAGTSLKLPYELPGYRHVYHLYVVETTTGGRDDLLAHLNDRGIDAKSHYPIAIHQQEGYPWGKEAEIRGGVPHSEWNAANCISLPMYPELTADEIAYTIDAVKSWNRAHG